MNLLPGSASRTLRQLRKIDAQLEELRQRREKLVATMECEKAASGERIRLGQVLLARALLRNSSEWEGD